MTDYEILYKELIRLINGLDQRQLKLLYILILNMKG